MFVLYLISSTLYNIDKIVVKGKGKGKMRVKEKSVSCKKAKPNNVVVGEIKY
jgi:hypothetical protein